MAYRNLKTGLEVAIIPGILQQTLASEAYRATGGVARNSIANHAIVWAAPTVSYLWPTRTELSRKVSENLKFLGRNTSVICGGSCHVTELEITSCPSKKEFSTLLISVTCTGVGRARKSFLSLVARAIRANRFARIMRNWNPILYSVSGRFARITRISDSRESPNS